LNELKTLHAEMLRNRQAMTPQVAIVQPLDPATGRPMPVTPNAVAPTNPDDPAPFMDRLTNEDVRSDTEFTVVMVVLLDPPAYTPPPATAESASAQ
jgi:hypothetical protein